MSKELDSAVSSFSEQTAKINIALHYAGGDMEKAKAMVAGSYKDLYVLKARFASSTLNGAFIVFYNGIYNKLVDSLVLVVSTYMTKAIDTAVDWKLFERDILEVLSSGEHDTHFETLVKNRFHDGFNLSFCAELTRFLQSGNGIAVERALQKLVQFILNVQRIDIKVDSQHISSLDMELNSASSKKLDAAALKKQPEEPQAVPAADREPADEVREGQEGVKLIMKCSLILSPIKGKDIARIEPGDRIRVSIADSNPKCISVAKALNAYEDGTLQPITARVKSIKPNPDGGYSIFAIVARGIYAKIVEEESNIKVALDPAYELARAGAGDEAKSSLGLILGLSVLFIVIIAAIVALVLYF
ncbi:MAG: hypothetical protein KBA15_03300 [Spirochaetes bacterium]|jgi:hypothetical protein|nr:hypothetical protein [Spirochaetota bacterium]